MSVFCEDDGFDLAFGGGGAEFGVLCGEFGKFLLKVDTDIRACIDLGLEFEGEGDVLALDVADRGDTCNATCKGGSCDEWDVLADLEGGFFVGGGKDVWGRDHIDIAVALEGAQKDAKGGESDGAISKESGRSGDLRALETKGKARECGGIEDKAILSTELCAEQTDGGLGGVACEVASRAKGQSEVACFVDTDLKDHDLNKDLFACDIKLLDDAAEAFIIAATGDDHKGVGGFVGGDLDFAFKEFGGFLLPGRAAWCACAVCGALGELGEGLGEFIGGGKFQIVHADLAVVWDGDIEVFDELGDALECAGIAEDDDLVGAFIGDDLGDAVGVASIIACGGCYGADGFDRSSCANDPNRAKIGGLCADLKELLDTRSDLLGLGVADLEDVELVFGGGLFDIKGAQEADDTPHIGAVVGDDQDIAALVGKDGACGDELADQSGDLVGIEKFEAIQIRHHLIAAWDSADIFVGDGRDRGLASSGGGDDLPEATDAQGKHLVFAQSRKEGAVSIAKGDIGFGDDVKRAATDFVADDKILAGLFGDPLDEGENIGLFEVGADFGAPAKTAVVSSTDHTGGSGLIASTDEWGGGWPAKADGSGATRFGASKSSTERAWWSLCDAVARCAVARCALA